jgi:hypothetical protein
MDDKWGTPMDRKPPFDFQQLGNMVLGPTNRLIKIRFSFSRLGREAGKWEFNP